MKLGGTLPMFFKNQNTSPLATHQMVRHSLEDLLILTILATICGAKNWVGIERFGIEKHDWLETFLDLSEGIPSPDVLSLVFSSLEPNCFAASFNQWVASLDIDLKHKMIGLRGTTVRGLGNRKEQQSVLHRVHVWVTQNRIMLAQVKTEDPSNEIKAIPKLLELIDIEGTIVTIGAIECHRDILQRIIAHGANYVVSLKESQATVYQEVRAFFLQAEEGEKKYKNIHHLRRVEKVHGQGGIETRRYTLISLGVPWLSELRWPGLKGIGKVDVVRTRNNQVERFTQYFISSLNYESIDLFKEGLKGYLHSEVNLSWSLNIMFRDNLNQSHVDHSKSNLSFIKLIALNLLNQEQSHKKSTARKRKMALRDPVYLLKVLTGKPILAVNHSLVPRSNIAYKMYQCFIFGASKIGNFLLRRAR
jgi:predicted transposase YbfD/YdcC